MPLKKKKQKKRSGVINQKNKTNLQLIVKKATIRIVTEVKVGKKPLKSSKSSFNCKAKNFRHQFYAHNNPFNLVLRLLCV